MNPSFNYGYDDEAAERNKEAIKEAIGATEKPIPYAIKEYIEELRLEKKRAETAAAKKAWRQANPYYHRGYSKSTTR